MERICRCKYAAKSHACAEPRADFLLHYRERQREYSYYLLTVLGWDVSSCDPRTTHAFVVLGRCLGCGKKADSSHTEMEIRCAHHRGLHDDDTRFIDDSLSMMPEAIFCFTVRASSWARPYGKCQMKIYDASGYVREQTSGGTFHREDTFMFYYL